MQVLCKKGISTPKANQAEFSFFVLFFFFSGVGKKNKSDSWNGNVVLAHCLCYELEMKGCMYFHLLCKVFIFFFFRWNWLLVTYWFKKPFQNELCSSLEVNRTLNTVVLLDRRVFQTISFSALTEFEYKLRYRTCRWGQKIVQSLVSVTRKQQQQYNHKDKTLFPN